MPELASFALVVVLVLGLGLAVGMLVAPRLTRWIEHDDAEDEEPGAGQP